MTRYLALRLVRIVVLAFVLVSMLFVLFRRVPGNPALLYGGIGLGMQPPEPELGTMVITGSKYLTTDQLLTIIPGLSLSLLILGLNVLGDGLRD